MVIAIRKGRWLKQQLEWLLRRQEATKLYWTVLQEIESCILLSFEFLATRHFYLVPFDSGVPKNAVGDIMPVLLATKIAIPVSINGMVKSTTFSRSAFIVNDVITMSTRRFARAPINPFHLPFCSLIDYWNRLLHVIEIDHDRDWSIDYI